MCHRASCAVPGVGIGSYFINRQLFIISWFAAFLLGKAGLAVLCTKTNEGPVNVLQYVPAEMVINARRRHHRHWWGLCDIAGG